jgi:hypothetical protein
MGTARKSAALALALTAASCGGGGSAGSSAANSSFGVVHLVDHSPAADAVQVPVDTAITLEFDAAMALDSFADEDTWLRRVGSSQNVPGTFARTGITRVVFTPNAALDLESDYEFQLSALTCDQAGRILDVTVLFAFRTLDQTPPRVTHIDVQHGSQSESRTRTYTVTYSEPVASNSVSSATFLLRDFTQTYAATYTVAGNLVTLDPHIDLPGNRQLFLVTKAGITDRAGNPVGDETRTAFRTQVDVTAPSLLSTWPTTSQTGVSPLVQPTFTFDESMDPASVNAASLLFQDQFGNVVPFAVESNLSQRQLRVRPTVTLQSQRSYTMTFLPGSAAARDVSGNALSATQPFAFTTGNDVTAPVVRHELARKRRSARARQRDRERGVQRGARQRVGRQRHGLAARRRRAVDRRRRDADARFDPRHAGARAADECRMQREAAGRPCGSARRRGQRAGRRRRGVVHDLVRRRRAAGDHAAAGRRRGHSTWLARQLLVRRGDGSGDAEREHAARDRRQWPTS